MEQPPRPREQPDAVAPPERAGSSFCGLVMAVGTLAVIAWANTTYDTATAHTMGLVTFSIFHLFFSLETADPERTIFSSELLDNPMLLKTTGVSILTILLATQFGPLQRILDTVGTDGRAMGAVRRRRGLDRRHLRGQEGCCTSGPAKSRRPRRSGSAAGASHERRRSFAGR